MSAVPVIKLHSGASFPQVGLGTWKAEKGKVGAAVKYAVTECGYRHLDCASNYLNEDEIGDALAELFESGAVKREDLWITGKLNNPYHHKEHVMPHLKKTLLDLRLDHLDLWLMHWPVAFKYLQEVTQAANPGAAKVDHSVSIRETWEAMEACVEAGLVKHIGLSNVPAIIVHDIMTYAKIKPAVIQNEMHPYCQQPALCEYARRLGIAMTAYSPLGTGSNHSWTGGDVLLQDPVLAAIAAKHGKTPAQVCIRWAVQRGTVVIPKSTHDHRIRQNIESVGFELDEEDMQKIAALDRNFHYLRPNDWYGIPLFCP
ncbi:aldo/keto reductase [Salpingoeca rosetta]|uniref:Aldo/keto reductase n=1 Tax=Salpingoeca rosetta (strain ATCC 50818 / BSB-021) TaxID=946362 RepID=F2UH86_SALR5|nr:aldo/keto reductase [Salpingoeca rosetta]EGD76485.1 aldo/keto reductase [Salpingoeca rosetta]|eukprot:XP_004991399.1 aldo/keto reductase [Salpingoeca rosetta]